MKKPTTIGAKAFNYIYSLLNIKFKDQKLVNL